MKGAYLVLLATFAVHSVLANNNIDWTSTVAGNGISFQAGVNVTFANVDADYDYRSVQCGGGNQLAYLVGSRTEIEGSSSGSIESEFNMAFISTVLSPPIAVQTLADTRASWTNNGLNFAFGGAVSAVLTVYDRLVELDTDGDVVASYSLATLGLSFPSSNAVKKVTNSDGATLYYMTLNTTSTTVPMSITFVVSEVLGVLSVGGAPITPKSMETIVEVLNYRLASSSNHLRLEMVVATAVASGSGTGTSDGNFQLVQGTGDTQAYFSAAGTAIISGELMDVNVAQVSATVNDLKASALWLGLAIDAAASLKGSLTVANVVVDFPRGAGSFTYDPASGFEAPKTSGATKVTVSLFALVASIFAALYQL